MPVTLTRVIMAIREIMAMPVLVWGSWMNSRRSVPRKNA
jgi:hypothetical protein